MRGLRMTQSGARTYELQALTDIWTGDAGTAQSKQANRFVPTGLLGSIRWWFEVLVRGLGGAPCDPSSNHQRIEPSRRSEEHTSELQSRENLVCRLLLE